MLSPEDELDVLHHDLGVARRRLWSLENAPYEGRAGPDWERQLHFARQRVKDLDAELRAAQAELIPPLGPDRLIELGWPARKRNP